MVAKQLFDQSAAGLLDIFDFIKDDMVYIKTTASFAPRSYSAGDEVQKTTLHFRSDAVMLARADVFLSYGDTESGRLTDAAGDPDSLPLGRRNSGSSSGMPKALPNSATVQDGNRVGNIARGRYRRGKQEVTVTSGIPSVKATAGQSPASGSRAPHRARRRIAGCLRKGNPTVYLSPAMQHLRSRHLRPHQHDLSICRRIWKTVYRYYHVTHLLGKSMSAQWGNRLLTLIGDHHNP